MFKKAIFSAVALTALAIGANAARADVIPSNSFTVSDGQYSSPATTNTFTADRIVGGYTEYLTFTNAARTTFDASLVWFASSYFNAGDPTPIPSTADMDPHTGLNSTYKLYALYQGSGTVSYENGGVQFNFSRGTGALNIYLDPQRDTSAVNSADSTFYTLNGASNDILLASGTPSSGGGELKCDRPSNCGSFGADAEIQLSDAGMAYFIAPVPFYGLSLQSGQFNNNFLVSQNTPTYRVAGSLDVTFAVPEPGMVGLLGLGLMAVTLSRRNGFKRKQG